jgi:lysophospholipase L1-like esterase
MKRVAVIGALLVLGWAALRMASPSDGKKRRADTMALMTSAARHVVGEQPPDPPMPPGLGVHIPLEDPSGNALDAFHAAIQRAAAGQGKARLMFYGGSHTASDHYTGYIRDVLQRRYGDAGRGFARAAWPDDFHYWQWGVRIAQGSGWESRRLGPKHAGEDYYGMAGVVFDSKGREAKARIETERWGVGQRASHLEVWYQTQPQGGRLEVRVDGKLFDTIDTEGPKPEAGFATYSLADGPHRVDLRAVPGASVRVYGVVLERGRTGVVVDNAGLSGARARFHLKWLDPVYSTQLKRRRPDLVVFFYGGNEGDDFAQPIDTYARKADKGMARALRRTPDASCVVLGPADKPLERDGEWVHRARTTSIARVQRDLAFRHGCAFFDTVKFMGGRLSMLKWVEADLARDDYIHFSARGYRRLGEVLLDGLLDGFEEPR